MLFTVKGTDVKSFSDLKTDVSLALGRLKNTKRYKDAKNGLEKARETLKPSHTIVAGHSLGGAISSYIASKSDKVYTLDKGATIGQKTRSNETAYRVKGDAASAAVAGSKIVTTLDKTNNSVLDHLVPFANTLSAHNISQIKDSGIIVDNGVEQDYKIIPKPTSVEQMPYA
jgi:predicted alpha/beta-fold hydrolase